MTVELLLMLRVLALYGNSKHMVRYLVFQFFFQIIAMTITALLILPETRSIPGRDVFAGCLLAIPDWAYWSWVQPLVVEIILVVLSFYQCRKYGSFSPTHKILARDSIIYFVSITSGLIFNLVYGRRHVLLGTAMTMPTSVLASIAAARLSMNIRSITMEQGFSTLAQQTHLTTIFQLRTGPEAIASNTRGVFSSDDIEEELVETLQQDDDHNQDQSLGLVQLYGVRELPKFN